jgi:murein DD-endopeptidase MepM/ murein hydrolase activator NlpD
VLLFIVAAVAYATISNAPFRHERSVFAAPVTGLSMPAAAAAPSAQSTGDQTLVRASTINKTIRTDQPVTDQQRAELQAFAAPPEPTPTPQSIASQEDAVVRAAAEAPPPVLPAYQVYQAQDGDSVYSIADRFGIGPDYILANNAELAATGFLSLGQSIIIPAGNGILHEVRYGETLSDIASRYDVDMEAIVGFAGNGIADANALMETQTVFVPGATILPAVPFEDPAAEEATPTEEGLEGDEVSDEGSGDDGSDEVEDVSPGIVAGGPSSGSGLIWPLVGPVSSPYGAGHPLGIDIDGFHLGGAAVAAATSGTVLFAGGNACCSYGLYVVIMSDSGIETLYAHLDSIYVSQGQFVSQGEAIGVVGSTGYSTGVHLHFEVIDNGVRQNPLNYLP